MTHLCGHKRFSDATMAALAKMRINWHQPSFEDAKKILAIKGVKEWILYISELISNKAIYSDQLLTEANRVIFFYSELMMIRCRRKRLIEDENIPLVCPETINELQQVVLTSENNSNFTRAFSQLTDEEKDGITINIVHEDLRHYFSLVDNTNCPDDYHSFRGERIREDIIVRLVCGRVLLYDKTQYIKADQVALGRSSKNVKSITKDAIKVIQELDIPAFQGYLGLHDGELTKRILYLVTFTTLSISEQLPEVSAKYYQSFCWGHKEELTLPVDQEKLKLTRLSNLLANNQNSTITGEDAKKALWGVLRVARESIKRHFPDIKKVKKEAYVGQKEYQLYQAVKFDLYSKLPNPPESIVFGKATIQDKLVHSGGR